MFGVEQGLAALATTAAMDFAMPSRFSSRRDAEGDVDVEVMGLADEADGAGCGRRARPAKPSSLSAERPGPLGHAEGGEGRAGRGRVREEFAVGRVRARPATLDVVDPERVERLRDLALLVRGELDALRLLPSRSVVSKR